MVKTYSIVEARDNLSDLVHEVESGIRVELTRRGKPVAVLLGLEKYEHLISGRRSFWESYTAFPAGVRPRPVGDRPGRDLRGTPGFIPGRDFS
jgi:prevent-host-death family protein